MLTNETLDVVKSREVTPLIDQVRAKLPLEQIERTHSLVTSAHYRIDSQEGEVVVCEYMRDTADWMAIVTEAWGPAKALFHAVHKACCTAEDETEPRIRKIRERCEELRRDWRKRKAESERQRQLELDASAEILRKKAAQEARSLAIEGNVAEAEAMLRTAQTLRAPTIMNQPTKLEGTSVTPKFRATVTDPMALIQAIVEGKIPLMQEVRGVERPLVIVDPVVVNFYATKLGKQLDWAGVTVEDDFSFSAKKR